MAKKREQMLRRLKNKANHKLRRKAIQKQKRLDYRTDRTFPKCDKCGYRNKWNLTCKNCAEVAKTQKEEQDALHLLPEG